MTCCLRTWAPLAFYPSPPSRAGNPVQSPYLNIYRDPGKLFHPVFTQVLCCVGKATTPQETSSALEGRGGGVVTIHF